MAVVANDMISKLTEVVLKGLLNQAQFVLDFGSQVGELKTQLDLVKAFLADSANLKIKKQTLRTTLIQLRDLVYEADDILTDCIIRDEYRTNESCSSFSPSEVLFKYQMGKKLKDVNLRMEKMERNLSAYLSPQQLRNEEDSMSRLRQFTTQDFDPSEIIGLENDIGKLKRWIFNMDVALHRIGIVGMGGLGKTTIAQKICNDKEVTSYFEKIIWVTVSQDFNEENIIKSILEQLDPKASGADIRQMFRKIQQLLQGKNCLIVMDDVWDINLDWWSKLCSGLQKQTGKSSCVIITTRNEEVAANMGVENSQIHRPKLLNEDESWSLFCKYAFSASKGKCHNDHFEKVGKNIVEKCGGLPLAIKTVAALLAQKVHSLAEWKNVDKEFHELTTRGSQITSVMASLQLSYDALPLYLKHLLLCFSIYPEDVEIQAEQLVHWWVGEGLIQGKGSKTAMELGYEYLAELARRCLIEVVQRRGYDGRVYNCKMHDLVRDLTFKIAEDEAFCSFERGKQKLMPDSRWLGFTSGTDMKLLQNCSKLRALLLMSSNQVFTEWNMGSLISLRVLDLSHTKLDSTLVESLLNWIISLKRLAHLNLRGATGLKEVPSSIRKLRNLQILVLAGCINLVRLHPSIKYLKKLVVLDLGSCGLKFLPQGIGRLSQLQELSGFRVVRLADTESCHLLELQELVQLRVLRMNLSNQSEISEHEFEVLSKLEKLKVLAINTEDCKDKSISEMLDRVHPPPNLQELYLRRYRHESLPKWINPTKLPSLQYLCIENGDLFHMRASSELEEDSGATWNLEGLCLKFLPNLDEDWRHMERTMPLLGYVEVSHCFNLKNFPCAVDKPGIWRKHED